MKIKVLNSSGWYKKNVGEEFEIEENTEYYDKDSNVRFKSKNNGWIYDKDCVITELHGDFCVKRCDDKEKWNKYVNWLKKKYYRVITDSGEYTYYGRKNTMDSIGSSMPFGIEIHIDDIIKHIDFYSEPMPIVENKEEFDMSTKEGRLAYAIKYYPIGTKYVPLDYKIGDTYPQSCESRYTPQVTICPYANYHNDLDAGNGFIYVHKFNKWAEIVKEEKMETQKLSRKGLKEIHSVACTTWKTNLENYSKRNTLEDYIELTNIEVNHIFNSCTKEQLPIVSKYLKQDDVSVDVTKFVLSGKGFCDDSFYIIRDRDCGNYKKQSFLLSQRYDWEIKTDELGQLCLIPTKKK